MHVFWGEILIVHLRVPRATGDRQLEVDILPAYHTVASNALYVPLESHHSPAQSTINAIQGYTNSSMSDTTGLPQ